MTPYKQYGDMLCFSSSILFCLGTWSPEASIVLALGGMLPLCATPEWLWASENLTPSTREMCEILILG